MRTSAKNSQTKPSLARVLAHELQAPLASMHSALSLLETAESTTEQQEYLAVLRQTNRYAIDLVQSWLEAEQLGSGFAALDVAPCNSGEVVRAVARELQPLATEHQQTIVVATKQWPMVLADRLRLQQILVNIVGNALRHGRSGRRVLVRARASQHMAVLSVQSPPATKAQREQLLAAWGERPRVPSSADGLGLYISRQLVEAHGGRLELVPRRRFTLVRIHVPLASQLSLLSE